MLTRKATYGIRALACMARARGRLLCVAELADREGIPPKFLAGILSDLRQHGFVRGRRGRVGGYQLAIAPESLRIADVVESLCGPLFPFECLTRDPGSARCGQCPGPHACPAHDALSGASRAAYAALRLVTLSEVAGLTAPAAAVPAVLLTPPEPPSAPSNR